MEPLTFVFIGRSGSGKGTQAALLEHYLEKELSIKKKDIFYLETGAKFREFIAKKGRTSEMAKVRSEKGMRQPDFLAIWMWSHLFIDDLKEGQHIMIDGTPRSLHEAFVLDTAFDFYERKRLFVIYIDVSRSWSEKHLLARGRADDVREDIKRRLDWYESDVVPAVDFFKNNPRYNFIAVNGEQPIESVHTEIVKSLSLV